MQIGETIGPYRIQRPLGQGGMGVVYLAIQTQLNRPVALKLLRGNNADNRDLRRRFHREMRMAMGLNHPCVVKFLDVETHDGMDVIVMEYVPGSDLASLLKRRGPLPWTLAAAIGVRLTDGLSYLHQMDVLHRDIKPGNILISAEGQVKLGDLGLAVADNCTRLTETGAWIGTLQYSAPEILNGAACSKASDLWAVGCCLYSMLTGQDHVSPESSGHVAFINALIHTPTPSPRSVNPEVPARVSAVVDALLDRDPNRRTHDAAAIRDQLEQELTNAGTSADQVLMAGVAEGTLPGEHEADIPTPSSARRLPSQPGPPTPPAVLPATPRPSRRSATQRPKGRRISLALLAVVFGLAALGSFILTRRSLPPPVDPFQNALQQCKIEQRAGHREAAIAAAREATKLGPERPESWLQLTALLLDYQMVEEARAALRSFMRLPESQGASYSGMAGILAQHSLWSEAEDTLQAAVTLHPGTALLLGQLAQAQVELDKRDAAGANAAKGLALDPSEVFSLYAIAKLGLKNRHWVAALDPIRKGIQLRPDSAQLRALHGELLAKLQDLDPMVVEISKAVELEPDLAAQALARFYVLKYHGAADVAEQLLRRCLATVPKHKLMNENLVRLLVDEGRGSDAEAHAWRLHGLLPKADAAEILLLARAPRGRWPPEMVGLQLYGQSDPSINLGCFVELLRSRGLLQRWRASLERELQARNPTSWDLCLLGELQARNGKGETALATLRAAVARDPKEPTIRERLAYWAWKQHRPKEAEAQALQADTLRQAFAARKR